MSFRFPAVLVTLAVIAAPVLAQPSAAGGSLTVYTTIAQDIADGFASVFMSKHPQIRLEVLRAGGSEMERRLLAEIETGGIRADVLWLSDPPFLLALRDRGHLQAYRSPQARLIAASLKDPRGFFTAARLINTVIAVNTSLIPARAAPKRWSDLPKYGRTGAMPNPLFSGSVLMAVSAFANQFGWGWFEQARREGLTVLRSNSDVARTLAGREFGVGMTLDTVTYRLARDGAPVMIVWPEEGAVSTPDLVAIVRASRNAARARTLVDFMLSKEGQEWLASRVSIPVRADVAPPPGLPRTDEIRILPTPYDWVARSADDIRRKFEEIMLR